LTNVEVILGEVRDLLAEMELAQRLPEMAVKLEAIHALVMRDAARG
jgi:hypothetical protein